MPESKKPNIILIMTDQQRGDALSIDGHPDLVTPNMDALAAGGAWFRQGYTPAPVCSPARHCILTGRDPAANGVLDNTPARIIDEETTLPALLKRAGYQTAEIGRAMHQYPGHARYGFEVRELKPYHRHDSGFHAAVPRHLGSGPQFQNSPHLLNHGMSVDGYRARPWPYDEAFHQTTWGTNAAIEFLERRDKEVPFFMYVGFVAPHPPLVPPGVYYDRYDRKELAPPVVGDWVVPPPNNAVGAGVHSGTVPLGGELIHQSMAGYYGLINHVDDMLFNLLTRARAEGPTYIIFTSDHGEMLGDHHLFRKSRPYQPCVRIPYIISGPGIAPGSIIDRPVSLTDILPTCCDLAGIEIPDHVDGKSVLPLIANSGDWDREYIHGEGPIMRAFDEGGFHFLTDGRWKYIYWSESGREQLFDISTDPREERDLSPLDSHRGELLRWNNRLVEKLRERPEGFVKNGNLTAGAKHLPLLPHARPV
jgi:arylsulfatase